MAEAKPNKRPQAYPKVNQEMIDRILVDIELGAPKKHAAEANGLSISHFHNLIAQGIVDLDWGKPETLQARLVVSLRNIEKKEIQECRKKVKASKQSHKGAEWTLEHAYWRYFGKDANAKELAEEIERLKNEMKGVHDVEANGSKAQEDSEE